MENTNESKQEENFCLSDKILKRRNIEKHQPDRINEIVLAADVKEFISIVKKEILKWDSQADREVQILEHFAGEKFK